MATNEETKVTHALLAAFRAAMTEMGWEVQAGGLGASRPDGRRRITVRGLGPGRWRARLDDGTDEGIKISSISVPSPAAALMDLLSYAAFPAAATADRTLTAAEALREACPPEKGWIDNSDPSDPGTRVMRGPVEVVVYTAATDGTPRCTVFAAGCTVGASAPTPAEAIAAAMADARKALTEALEVLS